MGTMDEFIRNNRDAFDLHEPPDKLWEKIEKRLQSQKTKNSWKIWLQRAAIFLAIFSVSFGISELIHRKGPVVSIVAPVKEQQAIPQELKETQVYYETRIVTRLKEMKPVFARYPGMEEEVHKDFTRLDSICADLKKDLKDNISNQRVLEAMIENYRTKLTILESLLEDLKRKNPGHENLHI